MGGKEGKFSISRVVGSNFPKNTPGECSIEDTYQIWRSYSDEKLVKIVTKIKGGEDEKGEKLNSEGGRVQFSEKHPWGMVHRRCIPSLKVLRWLEVSQNRSQPKRWKKKKERRRKKKKNFLARFGQNDKSITFEPSGISTCCKRLWKLQTEISSYTKNQGWATMARASLRSLKTAIRG